MTLLSQADARFHSPFEIVEGGRGIFRGILSDPAQGGVPAFQFNLPRRLLRVAPGVPLHVGAVVKGPGGSTYMVGQHAPASRLGSVTYQNFRLIETTGRYSWKGRGKTVDPITRLPRDTGPTLKGELWGAYEPAAEVFDRAIRTQFETARFITNREVSLEDEIDGKKVTRCDEQLGLYIVSLG